MDFLSNLMGGGGDSRREEYRDFANRYDAGAPYDNISSDEAENRYREIAPNLSEDEYRASAREAFSRMSPDERMQFGREFRDHAHQEGHGDFVDRDHDGQDDRFQDPDYLAGMTSRMNRQQPDLLGNLMGGLMGGQGGQGGKMGGGGSMMSNPVAKAAMAGIASMAVKRMMGGSR